MIHDSSYWKDSLRKHAEMLDKKIEQRVWRESSFSRVEQSVMLSCYIVRKLAEAKKIADAKFQRPMKMRAFRANGRTVDLLNSHKIDSLYHLADGTDITRPLSYVANQLIHSYIFVPVFESPGKLNGIAFNSDRSKGKELYLLELRALVDAFAACADSYISKATYFRLNNGELEVLLEDNL
ncbi:MAG: hypothetical protein V5B36_14340 [Candidatus Accumulibacter sp. UW25]